MSPSATSCTPPISTQIIRKLELAENLSISPGQTAKNCDDALQVAEADEELHRATQIFKTITNTAKCTLKIYLTKRKRTVFELPDNLKDPDVSDTDNWKQAQDWELDRLQNLRASVPQHTVQTVLDAASEILWSNLWYDAYIEASPHIHRSCICFNGFLVCDYDQGIEAQSSEFASNEEVAGCSSAPHGGYCEAQRRLGRNA